MIDANERIFKEGELVYVIDWLRSAEMLISTQGKILNVNNEKKYVTILLYCELYERYRFEDYGKLVFNTEKEVKSALWKIPKPMTTVYQIIDKKIYKRKVERLSERFNLFKEFLINFEKGGRVSVSEIGNTVFFTRREAKAKLKNQKK